ncbi:dipeptidase [Caldalkalibacillus mannanilyticus]|uniref:dipeptidase n=1 Tax=Caldalkalibacillus mannanilyticus TaxID=1418 RepID=UPI0006857F9C|nr:dipeptidase [Caldalkalibacillus mannanilyticus]
MIHLFDGHCDVLYQMWRKKNYSLFFQKTKELHCSFERLQHGGVKVQTMAIFVPPETPKEIRHFAALEMLDIFHHEILPKNPHIELITDLSVLEKTKRTPDDQKLYVLLAIEGAEPLQGSLTYLRTFYRLGVRSVGFTWNYRNEAGDGVRERHPAGLSNFGFELIEEMNRLHMAIDVSHLAEPGFWDCIGHSRLPVMASHCNAKELCNHPRNLTKDQLKAIFQTKGIVGITFVPYFLSSQKEVTITNVLHHLEYMLALGGEDLVGFGSDFDGIDETVVGLEHSGNIINLRNECLKRYSEEVVNKIFFKNWRNYYHRLWAESRN